MNHFGDWAPLHTIAEPETGFGPGTLHPLGFTEAELYEVILRARQFSVFISATTWSGSANWKDTYSGDLAPPGNDQSLPYSIAFPEIDDDQQFEVYGSERLVHIAQLTGEIYRQGTIGGSDDSSSYQSANWVLVETAPGPPPEYERQPTTPDAHGVETSISLTFRLAAGWKPSQPHRTVYFDEASGLYYPNIEVALSMTPTAGPVGPGRWVSSEDSSLWAKEGHHQNLPAFEATVFGKSLQMAGYYAPVTTPSLDDDIPPEAPDTVEIAISEWFSYGGRWDPSTGERVAGWAG